MSALAHWCARRRLVVVGAWLVLLVGLAVAALGAGARFTDSSTVPDSESGRAYGLLAQIGGGDPAAVGLETGNVVWHSTGVAVDAPAVRDQVAGVLTEIAGVPGVQKVVSPYDPAGAAQLNVGESTAYAAVTVTKDADADRVKALAGSLDGSTLDVQTGGKAFAEQPAAGGATEGIGLLAALVVLLVMFRSVWAAVLPLVTAVVGVGTSLLTVVLASHVLDLSSSTPTMGALIGLGVGIDYALFIVNRHRKALMRGETVPQAAAEALNTSGRAVLFAGGTVVIALLAMFVVGVGILTGMAQGAALTVVMTVAAAVTLLPALLALMGLRVLSRAQRRALATATTTAATAPTTARPELASRWAALVERSPKRLVAAAAVVLVVLALPALSLRMGSADASSDPAGTPTRSYFQTMAGAFGDGYDASLLVVASVPDDAAARAFTTMTERAGELDGVASVNVTPAATGQHVAVATIIPTSSAQTEQTADLVHALRDDVIPAAEQGNRMQVYVGGPTASGIDLAGSVTAKLPLYLGIVALLGFVLLAVAFRSILVPLIGALTNLVTAAVGLGAIVAIFQFGWGTDLLGVGSAAPVEFIIPILVVGVMSGLSMDYQVFLVSRMHEEWAHTGANARSIRTGLTETSRVIVAAGTIMLCVFASFGLAGERIISEIGVGLAAAVVVDVFVLRLVLVPALMHLLGRRNWAYPAWAERFTPRLSVEGAPAVAPAGLRGPAALHQEPERVPTP